VCAPRDLPKERKVCTHHNDSGRRDLSRDSLVESIRIANPYQYLGPLSRKELFFDRESEIGNAVIVCEQILRGAVGGLLIIGGRGSGKTSFLDALARELSQRKVAHARLPLSEDMVKPGEELRLFRAILTELSGVAGESGLIDKTTGFKIWEALKGLASIDEVGIQIPGISFLVKAKDIQSTQFPYVILRDGLSDFVKLLKEDIANRKGVVLMFDEGDHLTTNRTLMEILRNVFQSMPGMCLAIAGSTKLLEQASDVFSPFPRFFRKIELGPYPFESTVDDAIGKPLVFPRNEMAKKSLTFEVVHGGFDGIVKRTTDRMPFEINLLCHFAYDIGATRVKVDGKRVTLFMKFERSLLDEAMKQLRGTKEYDSFVGGLDVNEVTVMRILSACQFGATVKEITLLTVLNELGDQLQDVSIDSVIERIVETSNSVEKVESIMASIVLKASRRSIHALRSGFTERSLYQVEDRWIASYFKYSATLQTDLDIEVGLKPTFGGIRVFGDPVASVLHSVFFPRIAPLLGGSDSFRAHMGIDNGKWLWPAKGRKIILASYFRAADETSYHLAFQLTKTAYAGSHREEMTKVLNTLKQSGFVTSFEVVEKSSPI
jgi:hypothetical protein